MESVVIECKSPRDSPERVSSTTSSNQLFIPENLDMDDTFRMSLDNFSVIGENVTIGDRDVSVDSTTVGTPVLIISTPNLPDTPSPLKEKSPPILDTPRPSTVAEALKPFEKVCKPQNLLKLSLSKKNDNYVFVKPSPVAEVMSPAKMLQFEVDIATSATPTMKRAVVDFEFFNKNNFEEFFYDVPVVKDQASEDATHDKLYEETAVIMEANTVRHEIGYVTTRQELLLCYLRRNRIKNCVSEETSSVLLTSSYWEPR